MNDYMRWKYIVGCSMQCIANTSVIQMILYFQCIAIQWFEQKSEINIYRTASVIILWFACCQSALLTEGGVLSDSFMLERLCARFVTDYVRCLI